MGMEIETEEVIWNVEEIVHYRTYSIGTRSR